MQRLHHQRGLWCMTCLTRLINDLSKAHRGCLGKSCGHGEMQAECELRVSAESESRTLKLQMVSVTGVIIAGNYAALVILRLHRVWYFSYKSHRQKSSEAECLQHQKEQQNPGRRPSVCAEAEVIYGVRDVKTSPCYGAEFEFVKLFTLFFGKPGNGFTHKTCNCHLLTAANSNLQAVNIEILNRASDLHRETSPS